LKFLPMLDLLKAAAAGGYAVPAVTVWNAESMKAVLAAASDLRSPVILMNGPAEFNLLSPAEMGDVARAVALRYDVPAALHLDHGDSLELVRQCLDAGYTSVMVDYSSRPHEENAAALRQAVEMARPHGASVEGEIGHVGRADIPSAEAEGDSTLTQVAEAVAYVAATGVDALAVSIGNAHGLYTRLPRLDLQRLGEIRSAVGIPLVLHGGSGTPEADLKRAISLGIAKVNVATEIVTVLRESLLEQWQVQRTSWLPVVMAGAMKTMPPLVEKWIRATGSAGRA